MTKVKDALPIPTNCRYCQGQVKFLNNLHIYGTSFGNWPYVYVCAQCDAYVGVHPNTKIPLGTLANSSLRKARKKAKDAFNPIWMSSQMNRSQAYQWLAEQMGIEPSKCHFGWFEENQCKEATEICNWFFSRK